MIIRPFIRTTRGCSVISILVRYLLFNRETLLTRDLIIKQETQQKCRRVGTMIFSYSTTLSNYQEDLSE